MHEGSAQISMSPEGQSLRLSGDWTHHGVAHVSALFKKLKHHIHTVRQVNASGIDALDTAGVCQLQALLRFLTSDHGVPRLIGLSDDQTALVRLVEKEQAQMVSMPRHHRDNGFVYLLGRLAMKKYANFMSFVAFLGELVVTMVRCLLKPREIQWRSILICVDHMGFRALPIIALMSFLIGIVLTYQMGLQLEQYDANIYIVSLSGLAIFREFGPLITAIIAAGRTSTAFTSEIGSMKVGEEIDALKTMGLSPMQRLVFPKVVGLVIAIPLLTVWADIFGVFGSMVMSRTMLSISFHDFLARFHDVIMVQDYMVGVVKAPVFALIIAAVGCYQGFRVQRGAVSVGRMTTRSAVQSLFLIIIIDALFSVFFSLERI
jgi:phospholipid/cholesterol/gamma-HCH transport system permease protein